MDLSNNSVHSSYFDYHLFADNVKDCVTFSAQSRTQNNYESDDII